jgi:TolB protein
MMRRTAPTTLVFLLLPIVSLLAQDPVPPVEQGVRIGITYTPGLRPGLMVLGGPRADVMDSIRAILRRDLDHSDRFEMITLPTGDSVVLGISSGSADGVMRADGDLFVNYSLHAALGAEYAVAVLPTSDPLETVVAVYDVRGETERRRFSIIGTQPGDERLRMSVHRAADEIVRVVTGEPGFAASRILFISNGRLFRVDADGARREMVSGPGITTFSPAWDPTGTTAVYTELYDGWGRIVVHDVAAGTRRVVPATEQLLNYTAAVAPDGATVAFSRSSEEGTDIYRYNLARDCCLERLTVGRFSDNLSPTFSPDGRQIAFVTTRVGGQQIYVMSADGTGQELFAPFDYGVTGNSNAPEWSPDGLQVAFHRDVMGSPQIFLMDVRSRVVRQLTSYGRNEDPTWAADARHLAFISSRTGRRQVWIIDVESGRVRQLTTVGDARLPAWSPRIQEPMQP